jgi:hypothetical protein
MVIEAQVHILLETLCSCHLGLQYYTLEICRKRLWCMFVTAIKSKSRCVRLCFICCWSHRCRVVDEPSYAGRRLDPLDVARADGVARLPLFAQPTTHAQLRTPTSATHERRGVTISTNATYLTCRSSCNHDRFSRLAMIAATHHASIPRGRVGW